MGTTADLISFGALMTSVFGPGGEVYLLPWSHSSTLAVQSSAPDTIPVGATNPTQPGQTLPPGVPTYLAYNPVATITTNAVTPVPPSGNLVFTLGTLTNGGATDTFFASGASASVSVSALPTIGTIVIPGTGTASFSALNRLAVRVINDSPVSFGPNSLEFATFDFLLNH
jgi:hypothetical protein